jgi:hypothetical protein
MKLNKAINPQDYGFVQWASGVWYYECKTLESQTTTDLSFIIEDNELRLYHTLEVATTKNTWLDSVFDIPEEVIRLIRDSGKGEGR